MKFFYSLTLMAAAATATVGAVQLADQFTPAKTLSFPALTASKTVEACPALEKYAPSQTVAATPGMRKLPKGAKLTTVIYEDFAKCTAGSESAPDSVLIDSITTASLVNYPGEWILFRSQQAGGSIYTGFDEVGSGGPGYIKSPGINLCDEGSKVGYYRFSCRAKNVNASATDQLLQAFILDEAASSMISASAQPLVYNEWTECEWIGAAPSDSVSFMILGWKGKILIDDFKVEKMTYGLATPNITAVEYAAVDRLRAKWDAVEGASSYKVDVVMDDGSTYTATVDGVTETEIEYTPIPNKSVVVYVTAINDEAVSYHGVKVASNLAPKKVVATTPLPATDVTEKGFTANWEVNPNALNYLVSTTNTAKPTEDTEVVFYDENFALLPAEYTDQNPLIICPALGYTGMDLFCNRAGWAMDYGFMAHMGGLPVVVVSNEYTSYGILGMISSPVMDFSCGDGKVTVSGMGLTALDDAVVTVGFADTKGNIYSSTTFDVNTNGVEFNVTLEGGKPDSKIVMYISDAAGAEMFAAAALKFTKTVKAGESFTYTCPTKQVDYKNTSANIKLPLTADSKCSYKVCGYYSRALIGPWSAAMDVDASQVALKELADNVKLEVETTAEGLAISSDFPAAVYSVDGKVVAYGLTGVNTVAVPSGVYLVKAGTKVVKVVK